MTLEQAKYVKYLRDECDCSWRALDYNYRVKYQKDTVIPVSSDILLTVGGNQIDGEILHRQAEQLLGEKFE